ncbi:hypothetical protein N9Y26_01000 [bacterium]|nr:hypothetical protein [bacterium]
MAFRQDKYYIDIHDNTTFTWTREEVDEKLKQIMKDIHASCVTYGTSGHNNKCIITI